ncbi:uncharacterized protein LOC143469080 [Clavelina lepadiformis]|uniref:uncharacterized protein LOC143469080 n=1 Tax=Clavelina lepadiformis TaxID=159417 RepID=UPI00404179B2
MIHSRKQDRMLAKLTFVVLTIAFLHFVHTDAGCGYKRCRNDYDCSRPCKCQSLKPSGYGAGYYGKKCCCHKDAWCTYKNYKYGCECKYGYRGDGVRYCNSYSKPNCGQSCKKDSDCKRDGYGHYNPCDECKIAKGSYHGYNYRKCCCPKYADCVYSRYTKKYDCKCKYGYFKKNNDCVKGGYKG